MLKHKRYLSRSYYWEFRSNRYRRRRVFKYIKSGTILYLKSRILYQKPLRKIYIEFYPAFPFNAYQTQIRWLKRKFLNRKYHLFILLFKESLDNLRKKCSAYFSKFFFKRLESFKNLFNLYNLLFYFIYTDLYNLVRFLKTKKQRSCHYIIFSFIQNRLFINLQNINKKNYLFMSTGLFIKFFERRKSFKKNKLIKLLMAKFLRKLIILSRITNVILFIKNNPVFLLEIINFLNTPIAYKFVDPHEPRTIEETEKSPYLVKILYFIFLNNRDFSKNKKRKQGRVKRKILRKLVFQNRVID
jgi:hypothetical protein